jgi:hypothetical protein
LFSTVSTNQEHDSITLFFAQILLHHLEQGSRIAQTLEQEPTMFTNIDALGALRQAMPVEKLVHVIRTLTEEQQRELQRSKGKTTAEEIIRYWLPIAKLATTTTYASTDELVKAVLSKRYYMQPTFRAKALLSTKGLVAPLIQYMKKESTPMTDMTDNQIQTLAMSIADQYKHVVWPQYLTPLWRDLAIILQYLHAIHKKHTKPKRSRRIDQIRGLRSFMEQAAGRLIDKAPTTGCTLEEARRSRTTGARLNGYSAELPAVAKVQVQNKRTDT